MTDSTPDAPAPPGSAIRTVELGDRTARRLAMLRAGAEAAAAVVRAAIGVAEGARLRYEEALSAELEARGVETSPQMEVEHDAEKGRIACGPPGSLSRPAPNGSHPGAV